MTPADLAWWGWTLLGAAAIVVGLSKTGIPGAGTISVAIFAAVLPARQSTGTLLLLLVVADVFAVVAYRRHADWRTLLRLAPAVVAGVALGVVFLAVADDSGVRRVIGVLLLLVVAVTLIRRRWSRPVDPARSRRLAAAGYGTLGGFTTMVANAGGPVMSMYFLAARFPVKAFLGTAAWFFAIVNVAKIPFSVGLGLITPPGLLIDVLLVPLVIGGALLGRVIAGRIDQGVFEVLVTLFTIAGGVYLLVV